MKEENLLSYEQLQKIFDREHPQSSLLFDTGAGYFAFCVMARHLLDQGIGNAIQEDNAMKEVKKYVKKSEKSTKKKILVVDDSLVVQQSMKDLLGTDYEISVAQSGLAAIRCITLDYLTAFISISSMESDFAPNMLPTVLTSSFFSKASTISQFSPFCVA